jgi:hypothetical protein
MSHLSDLIPQVKYKDQLLEFSQLQGVVDRADILLGGDLESIKQQSITNTEVTWEMATDFYNSFPVEIRDLIKKSGQQLLQGWYNPLTKELDAPGSKPTDERGILICQMYLQQDAKCAYSGDGPCHILDFQVEHIVPEDGDYPENIVLVLANVNENKKQNMVTFVNRARRSLSKGREAYQAKIDLKRQENIQNNKDKDKIMAMNFEQLREYVIANGCNKYVWRNVGMSSLGEFRILKNSGKKRAGGSQGNYRMVLDTVAREFLFGDKEVSKDLFSACRLLTSKYRNGEIQNDVYGEHIASIIETSEHKPQNFCFEKLVNQITNSTYKWPHL